MLAWHDVRGREGPLDTELPRPADPGGDVRDAVAKIIDRVRADGDRALRSLTAELDGVSLDELRVPGDKVRAALGRVPADLRHAIEVAHRNITDYHAQESAAPPDFVRDGLRVRHLVRPVRRAGCYAPGGRARYPSTVLMCATPARVAGVEEIVLCVPPGPDGRVDDATLAAAAVAGVGEVFRVGGAQAIAAMAYGTESIRSVDVVVGPGNRYVAEAQRQVSGAVGVAAGFAGPSEVVVVAAPDTPPLFAAVDMVVQAEHGPDGAAWLVTWSEDTAREVEREVARLVEASPRRGDLEQTLGSGGHVCLVEDATQAIAVANVIAPEHLELLFDGAETWLDDVRAAGAVFCGPWTPASLGDYVAGPNHVLPTHRTARFASALRTDDFLRHIHAVSVDHHGLGVLGPAVVTLARTEGLPAHAASIEVRS
jgi:histidinol dehydrogenase